MSDAAADAIVIREMQAGDAAAARLLFFETIRRVNRRDYTAEQVEAWAPDRIDPARWERSFADKFAVVAWRGDRVLGFADLRADGYLDRFFVHHDTQRSGVGRKLLAAIEDEARRLGLSRIFLDASLTARPFFEAFGYRVDRAQTVEVRGVAMDNFAMSKALAAR